LFCFLYVLFCLFNIFLVLFVSFLFCFALFLFFYFCFLVCYVVLTYIYSLSDLVFIYKSIFRRQAMVSQIDSNGIPFIKDDLYCTDLPVFVLFLLLFYFCFLMLYYLVFFVIGVLNMCPFLRLVHWMLEIFGFCGIVWFSFLILLRFTGPDYPVDIFMLLFWHTLMYVSLQQGIKTKAKICTSYQTRSIKLNI
jgi:hypothetical protein